MLRREGAIVAGIVLGTAILLVATHHWAEALERGGARFWLRWIPLTGHLVWRWQLPLTGAVVLGAAGAWWGPVLAARLSWARLLVASWLGSLGWCLSVALGQGWHRLTAPLTTRYEYLSGLPALRQLGWSSYVRTFVERLPAYPTHVKGHPPGVMGLLWLLDRAGAPTAGGLAAVVIVVGSTAVVPALIAGRVVAGEALARRAAPFLVIAPAAILMATSGDALFAALGAWAVGVSVLAAGYAAVRPARPARASGLAFAAGMLGGVGLHMSYGLLALLAVPVPYAVARRATVLLVPALVGLLVVTIPWMIAGYWWMDGLEATRAVYMSGAASSRPYHYFLVTNLVVFAAILGPAVLAGVWALARHGQPVGWLVWPTVAVIVLVDLSGLTKGEVERIWLPFVPWLALACGVLTAHGGLARARLWLSAQVVVTLVLQQAIAWKW